MYGAQVMEQYLLINYPTNPNRQTINKIGLKAKAIGVDKALSWILSGPLQHTVVETDSLITVHALNRQ